MENLAEKQPSTFALPIFTPQQQQFGVGKTTKTIPLVFTPRRQRFKSVSNILRSQLTTIFHAICSIGHSLLEHIKIEILSVLKVLELVCLFVCFFVFFSNYTFEYYSALDDNSEMSLKCPHI